MLFLVFIPIKINAQYNTDRLLINGKSALYYEDYVVSIQYFNTIIALKPHLYEPFMCRAIAKYSLEDYYGAELDCNEAIKLNPYMYNLYDLRGLCLIQQNKYEKAIDDYNKAVMINPASQNCYYNRVLCNIKVENYKEAHAQIDTIISKWSNFSLAYSAKAEVFLLEKDTIKASEWLEKSIEKDKYNVNNYILLSLIKTSQEQWNTSELYISKAIKLKPLNATNYVNRALIRLNLNNLRGAMNDYNTAIDLDKNNFIAHFNRALLCVKVGENHKAIDDFNFIINLEPNNIMAIYNRAELYYKIGKYKEAIKDYTTIIQQYPDFWAGLYKRADSYRKIGQVNKAEFDEFKILKAQMNKHVGVQKRWTKHKLQETRRKSEIDFDKYNQPIVEDKQEIVNEYKSNYRGKIQNKKVSQEFLPMFAVSFDNERSGISKTQIYDNDLNNINKESDKEHTLYITTSQNKLSEIEILNIQAYIDTLTTQINNSSDIEKIKIKLIKRAISYAVISNYFNAIDDINKYQTIDSTLNITYWLKAVYLQKQNIVLNEKQDNKSLFIRDIMYNINKSIEKMPTNSILYYIKGNIFAYNKQYDEAIINYSTALKYDKKFAEAYYNRGIAYANNNKNQEAIKDLSKAGELGLYNAYSIIKQINSDKKENK